MRPSLARLLSQATIADGVAFAPIEDVRKWKTNHDQPNRDTTLRQIDDYMSFINHSSAN